MQCPDAQRYANLLLKLQRVAVRSIIGWIAHGQIPTEELRDDLEYGRGRGHYGAGDTRPPAQLRRLAGTVARPARPAPDAARHQPQGDDAVRAGHGRPGRRREVVVLVVLGRADLAVGRA